RSGKAKPLPASCYPAALRLAGLPVLAGTPFCRSGKAQPLHDTKRFHTRILLPGGATLGRATAPGRNAIP
ncbi:hypothetical protein ACLH2I_24115, partial [Klebsiella aerogenes]|uniref:hypothetical protein n=1 Tax=Klebsiella aerogenes TaxID=548 RepID=UPI0039836DAA